MAEVLEGRGGRGTLTVIGLWNFRLLGSTVMTGATAPPCWVSSRVWPGSTSIRLSPTLICLVSAFRGKLHSRLELTELLMWPPSGPTCNQASSRDELVNFVTLW